jgi:hypothetical protein
METSMCDVEPEEYAEYLLWVEAASSVSVPARSKTQRTAGLFEAQLPEAIPATS